MSDIKFEDLCNLIALKINNNRATPNSVSYYLEATYKVILDQLKLNNRIYIKDFGAFEVRDRKGGERIINNPMINEKQLMYVEPKKAITFKPAKKFDLSVNENDFKLVSDIKLKNIGRKHRKKLNSSNKHIRNIADLLNKANQRKVDI